MNDNLCLSLLRRQGGEDRTVLVLAASGIPSMTEEDAIILGDPLSEDERDVLRQAEISFQKDEAADSVCWKARCLGGIWVCAINDTRLARGEARPVKQGDRIDIGLLRFKVVSHDEISLPRAAHGAPAEEEAKSLDLAELAHMPKWNVASEGDNPFDIVGVHVPYLDEARPVPDLPGHSGMGAPEDDVLGHLADEYAQVILNPDHLYRQHGGENAPESEHPLLSREDVLPCDQEWEKHQSLEDFVSGKLTIQDILDHLGIDDFQQLEVSDPSDDDVLMLFAQGMAQGLKRSERIPERTRRDHLRVGADSHYQQEERRGGSGDPQTASRSIY
ncbi:MAG: TagK domain-containing protein [Zoogloeaceae bacterium]|jgi:hypothetical protein|nr:TagK domain-containing protein [Zoogloeaceae bacterium]